MADTRAAFAVGPRTAPLAADETLTVAIHGENGQCTGPLAIPNDAVAVALNVTATNATTNSNIRVFPADLADVPLLSNLNVSAGAPPTPNKVDVKLSPDGDIKVYNFRGSVNIFIDIVGYYTNSTLKEVDARLTALESALDDKLDASKVKWAIVSDTGELLRTDGAVASNRQSLGFFEVVFDSDVSNCSAIASVDDIATGRFNPGDSVAFLNSSDPTALFVAQYSGDGTRVADHAFTVVVICP